MTLEQFQNSCALRGFTNVPFSLGRRHLRALFSGYSNCGTAVVVPSGTGG